MMRSGVTIVCVLLVTASAAAQSVAVSGVVLDARTGRALSDVLVSIEGVALAVKTDAGGRFQLTLPPGRYVLTASLVGYVIHRRSLDATPGEQASLTISLAEGAGGIEEHVIVSGAVTGATAGAPGEMALHGRELQALRGVTLDDPLRAVQSVPSASATDDFYAEFAVRGSPFRHVGLVVDGVPTRYLMHAVHGVQDGGSIAMVNSDGVARVSLLPGSYTQRAGSSLGARMDLDLREGDRERLRARLGLSGTSATALVEGPLPNGRGSWLVSARRSYLDLLLQRIDESNSLAFGFIDGEAKLVVDVTPRHQIQFLALAGRSDFEEDPESLGANDEAQVTGRTWLSAATWRFAPSAGFVLTQKLYATGLTYMNTNRAGGVLDDALSADTGWRLDAAAGAGTKVVLEFGADAQRLHGRHARRRALDDGAELSVITDHRTNGHAFSAYGQAVLRVSRIGITPGVRLDRWGPTDAVTASPWLTSTLDVTGSTRVRAGAGVYRQFSTLEQIHGARAGGTDLWPETARHLDVAVSQQLQHGLGLQLTWYGRDEADVLWAPDAEPRRLPDGSIQLGRGDARWFNRLEGRARGIEIVLRRDAPSGLSGWAGYAFGRHRYTDVATGEAFWADFDQRHGLSLFGHYRLSNRTALGAKFRYGSNYPLTGYIREQPAVSDAPPLFGGVRPLFYGLAEARNTVRLPAYARLDVRIDRTLTLSGRRMTLFAEVANVLNRRNVRNTPYDVDRIGRVLGPTDTLLPILPSAGFVLDF
jgi:hypothetical protein